MLPSPRPAILFQDLPDGAVLLDTTTEVYYGLDPVGARVWSLLPPATRTLDELCAALAAEYPDAPPDALRADVCEFLDHLAGAALVHPGAGEGDATPLAAPAA